ncbi:uncharacterized protein ACLA_058310 [Aspergillus clavatus NRRL 1]|uniref:DUF7707 domain-containing protein n=1 Tax=Aspergillus clavatus (strain ATCC 1007 / CBS 513.65 / DSM 816 / NCTC 3887 / NRRL 1 / QM 1276 / 107) TaxID=344612 RepID=A1C433_ASPCL|nr:uncharacterized protein ACLA_058310 [Aspergillus clavatus NRRL 1]EAW15173.1 conserved hypothetical protein [Aspergillus clavatus NRRL 1]
MIFSRTLLAAVSLVGLVSGQSWTSVNISNIDIGLRNQWCQSQTSSCPLLCLQMKNATDSPEENTCDSDTLEFSCICDNNKSPNASEYSQTIPYFLCSQQNDDCVTRCDGDSTCQSDCRSKHPCGAQAPKRVNVTTTTSATSNPTNPAKTATGTLAAFTGEPSDKKNAAPAIDRGYVYGLCVVVGSFVAGFTVLL